MENLYLLQIIFVIITVYLIGVAGKFKAPISISDSDYLLTTPWKWLFEAMIFSVAICIFLIGQNIESYSLMIGAGLFSLVGVFSRFKKNKYYKFGHMLGAFGGFILLGISFLIELHYPSITLLVLIITALITALCFKKSRGTITWVVEITLIYTIFIGLFYVLSTF